MQLQVIGIIIQVFQLYLNGYSLLRKSQSPRNGKDSLKEICSFEMMSLCKRMSLQTRWGFHTHIKPGIV